MWRSIVALAFILIVALLSAYNADYVSVSYIFGTARVRLALVIVLSVLVGALIVAIASSARQIQMKREVSKMKAELSERGSSVSREERE